MERKQAWDESVGAGSSGGTSREGQHGILRLKELRTAAPKEAPPPAVQEDVDTSSEYQMVNGALFC